MGTRGYNVWTPDEEEALRKGVKKHGLGAWEVIRKDPDFKVLENRTGVQLKDKFRNLVKFRHITAEESRALKPKGSGPWSRKHSATGFRDRSSTGSPTGNELPLGPGAEEHDSAAEHAAALLALDAGKSQQDGETTASDPGGSRGDDPYRRKRRRSQENRSYGIYDQRRYRSDGTLRGADDELTESDDNNPSRPRQRRSYSGGGSGRYRGRARGRRRTRNVDDESTETTTEEEDYYSEHDEPEQRGGEDDYVVNCPCGVRFDDGAMMVECEVCKTWAHIDCLQFQAASSPVVQYDFNNYICLSCQGHKMPAGAQSMLLAAKATNGPAKGRMPNGLDMNALLDPAALLAVPGLNMGLPATAALGARFPGAQPQEPGHMLLGMINGDLGGSSEGLQRANSKQLKREATASGSLGALQSLSSGLLAAAPLATPAYMDTLSLFLAASARPSSALGQRPNSPRSGPTSPSKTAARSSSRAAATSTDAAASHQNLDKLLAAASAPGQAAAEGGGEAAGKSGGGPTEGGPTSPSALKRAGSTTQPAPGSQPANGTSGRPASRGPVGAEIFGDSDDDLHQSAALAQLFNSQTNDRLLQMLSANRAATPSQVFLESLMRGATPDIGLAPLMQSAAMQGAAAAAAAAAQAQMQYLQSHGLGSIAELGALQQGLAQVQAAMVAQGLSTATTSAGGNSNNSADGKATDKARTMNQEELLQLAAAAASGGLGLPHMELRPGTPDTWALLRGTTPTPDAMGLHHPFMGIPPLAGFSADPTWLLHRGSPALAAQAEAQAQQAAAGQAPGAAGAEGAAADAQGPKQGSTDAAAVVKAEPEATAGDNGPTTNPTAAQDKEPEARANGDHPTQPIVPQVLKPVAVLAEAKLKPQASKDSADGTDQAAAPAAPEAPATAPAAAAGTSAAQVLDMAVDRKASLGAIGSAAELAAAAAACGAGHDESYFNVEDMLRSSTPAPR